ncbi:nucleotidyltransferase domain-containing protein [Kitasatospora sp. NPDC006697]|uniref:nucleotidyltransferase domain-containing protein n=1 Tax=Kitasatospora sp. NPDC006697 TaxID=3364020 RepID=UPI0036775B1B
MTDSLPPGGVVAETAELEARWAHAWTPEEAAERLRGCGVRWCVAGGWAVDLFRGEGPTRPHEDLEIAIPAARFPQLREHFAGYAFDVVGDGRIWADAPADALAAHHQTWLREPADGDYRLDVFREPHDGELWICRRDPAIRLPYEAVIAHTAEGIPYLVPEVALLFKAKAARPKDRADFEGALPLLGPARRARLRGWLERVHPGHRWLAELAEPAESGE